MSEPNKEHRITESLRICFVYDCLFPWTVGGAERWLTALARHAAEAGHSVTYITRLQWDEAEPPDIPGVTVVAVSRFEDLYNDDGTRTLGEPMRFGWGVFRYLRKHAADFDVIHVHATPLFGVLGAGVGARRSRAVVFVDWAEVWTRDYWREYAGPITGTIAWGVQRWCVRLTQHAFVPSRLHARRLKAEGLKGGLTLLSGQFDGTLEPAPVPPRTPPTVVFAGRHIPEKGVLTIPPAIAAARRSVPGLRAVIFGDGPDTAALRNMIEEMGLTDVIDTPGFVETETVHAAIGSAACLLLPSSREGYGLVVVEAASKGTPSVVVAGPDNASVELISPGENGFVADNRSPDTLAACIVECVLGGTALRQATWAWAQQKGPGMTSAVSIGQVLGAYRDRIVSGPDSAR